jgi:hypothetical protein
VPVKYPKREAFLHYTALATGDLGTVPVKDVVQSDALGLGAINEHTSIKFGFGMPTPPSGIYESCEGSNDWPDAMASDLNLPATTGELAARCHLFTPL